MTQPPLAFFGVCYVTATGKVSKVVTLDPAGDQNLERFRAPGEALILVSEANRRNLPLILAGLGIALS